MRSSARPLRSQWLDVHAKPKSTTLTFGGGSVLVTPPSDAAPEERERIFAMIIAAGLANQPLPQLPDGWRIERPK